MEFLNYDEKYLNQITNINYENMSHYLGLDKNRFEKELNNFLKNGKIIILWEDDDVIGFFGFKDSEYEDNFIFLDNIQLKKEVCGKGYGKRVLWYVEDIVRKRNKSGIHLYTNVKNVKAIEFYLKNGFKKDVIFENGKTLHMIKSGCKK